MVEMKLCVERRQTRDVVEPEAPHEGKSARSVESAGKG
jgi:hypothetical protein